MCFGSDFSIFCAIFDFCVPSSLRSCVHFSECQSFHTYSIDRLLESLVTTNPQVASALNDVKNNNLMNLEKIKGNLSLYQRWWCPYQLLQPLCLSTDSIGRRVKSVGIKLALRLNAIPSSISLESWGTFAYIKEGDLLKLWT